ncbi:hypothetical protein EC844_1305 [Acinetobacter calcoaceticus]|uniref:Lipoprotein n=1 Tax=Acinetobacter calcoaceticus TaxID=471 RepID=A0A4R1XHB0_ACICA|nr:hypothetical protein EC844_1305 [Acinetobacter calcoaceticus]
MVNTRGFKMSILLVFSLMLQACVDMDILMTPDIDSYLRDKDGDIVDDCKGDALYKKSSRTNRFWERNNLSKGTIEFVCVDGKAYLPGQEPKN